MTETLVGVSPPEPQEPPAGPTAEELEAARELVRAGPRRGVALTGPDGLLKALTKTVIETALEEEMAEHLGYDKHDAGGPEPGQLPQRQPVQDGADRQRPARSRSTCPGTATAPSTR